MNNEDLKQFNKNLNKDIKNQFTKEEHNTCDCGCEDEFDTCDCGCEDELKTTKHECSCGNSEGSDKHKKSKNAHECHCNDKHDAEIEKLTKQRDEYLDMARRSMAEFANFKKRNEEAISVAMEAGSIKAISQVLPSIDALEKAMAIVSDAKTIEGLELIKKDIERIFAALNITEIDAINQAFDPKYHEAIATVPAEDEKHKDTVAEVYQKGYMYKDKVLRYAIVKVAK